MTTLLCFAPAGSGSADYRGWTELLPSSIRVEPVVLPGRERLLSHAPHDRMPDLVAWLLERDLPDDYAIYGHSFGAWVGYELARAASARGRGPRHLFVGARRAPHLPATLPPLAHLSDEAFVAGVQERYEAIPEQLLAQPRILAIFLPALRADFALMEGYLCEERAPIDVPITGFRGLADDTVQRSEVVAWQEHTSAPFQLRQVPGGHFFLREDPELVCDAIAGALR